VRDVVEHEQLKEKSESDIVMSDDEEIVIESDDENKEKSDK
jgi:hypothetical protein